MTRGGPPKDVPPERLFRQLLAFPRPVVPISFRFVGIQHPPLTVCALRADEANEAFDAASGRSGEAYTEAALCGLAARSLRANGVRVFQSLEDVMSIPSTEFAELMSAFADVFFAISPLFRHSNAAAWHEKLLAGAKAVESLTAVKALGTAYDLAGGIDKPRIIPRPDRYFGAPTRELLDGHWMAYRAARAVYEEYEKR